MKADERVCSRRGEDEDGIPLMPIAAKTSPRGNDIEFEIVSGVIPFMDSEAVTSKVLDAASVDIVLVSSSSELSSRIETARKCDRGCGEAWTALLLLSIFRLLLVI